MRDELVGCQWFSRRYFGASIWQKRQFGELLFWFLEALILGFGSRETFYAFGRFEVAIFRSHKAIRSQIHPCSPYSVALKIGWTAVRSFISYGLWVARLGLWSAGAIRPATVD